MKKILVALVLVFAIGGYAFWTSSQNNAPAVATTTDTSTTVTSAPSETTNPAASGSTGSPNSTGSTGTSGSTVATGQYKDGTYTGSVADAFYGNIQVEATVSGGKLINVTFLQYPNDQHDSVQINTRAMPILKSEAISAQSAKVNTVSGATDTSGAFVQSLSSALSQALS